MTLLEWTKDTLKDGVELFNTERMYTNDKGVMIRRDCTRLRDISLGLVSCDDSTEWYRLVRQCCPAGTIIEEYNEEQWKPLFEDAVAIVRNELVKTLIKERANKSAKTLLDILSKRDKAHWDNSKSSTATVDLNKETNDIRVKFEVVGG
jgi:hypothetical protein